MAVLTAEHAETHRLALEHHLEDCAACRQQLDRMTAGDDNWLGDARTYAKSGFPILVREVVGRFKLTPDSIVEFKDNSPDPLPGAAERLRQLGDYEILGELGRGGMGLVFKARQVSLQRTVALKVILSGQLASEALVRRFHLEAEAAARLDHPNIVPIYEIGEYEGRHFFSMKLIEGASLKDRRAEFQALRFDSNSTADERLQRERKLARLMAGITRAVHHAHQRGILHRDLKPGNVLIDAKDQPHLTDFGLAKVVEGDSDLTLSRAVMGTPAYLSPEQAAGQSRMITTASDVYGLGAILYELLAGQPPFDGDDVMLVLSRTVNEEPKSPKAINPSVSRDLEIICLNCLEKSPAQRHQSAEALADELEKFWRGEAIRSRPVSTPERAWRWCKRKPALAGALGALVLVFILGFAGVAWKWRGEVHQRRLAEQATRQTEKEKVQTQQALVRLEIERAEVQFHDGNSDKALANLARLLRRQPTNQVAAERLMNALMYRSFCLPIAPLRHDGAKFVPKDDRNSQPPPAIAKRPKIETTCVSFNPDGNLVITASLDGTARLWNSRTGKLFGEPLKHDGGVLWAQFSPDGTTLVTACEDGAARIWNVQASRLVAVTLKRRAAMRYASFSPDGEQIVTASNDGMVQVWSAKTGQPMGEPFIHDGRVYFAEFNPNGRQLLTAETVFEGSPAHLWDLKTRAKIKLPHHPREEIRNPFPCFSPSGDQVLVFEGANAFLFLTENTGKSFPRPPMQLHQDDDVGAVAFSPDVRFVATGSHDATAQLWNAETGQKPIPRLLHKQAVNSVQFSHDGRTLLTGSSDRTARLWNVESGQPLMEPLRHAAPVFDALLASNRLVTISEMEDTWLWDVPSGLPPAVSWQEDRGVNYARFSADGKIIVSLSRGGVSFTDARTGQPARPILKPRRTGRQRPSAPEDAPENAQQIFDIDFSSDSRQMATALEFGNVLLWEPFAKNANSNRPVRLPFGESDTLKRGNNSIRSVRVSPDDRFLLAASDDGNARLWEIEKHRQVFSPLQHEGRVNHAEFNCDGKLIVTASWDKTARVWNAETGKPSTPPLPHGAEVNWARFDPSGTKVVSASRDKTVCVWSAQTGEKLLPPLQHANALAETHPFDFNSDGRLLATVAGDSLQVWDLTTGRSVLGPIRQTALLQSVRFSRDGKRLVTAANDNTARLWDANTGHPLGEPLRHGGRVTYAEFSPDGQHIVTSSWDDHVRVWPVVQAPVPVPAWLPDLAEALAGQRILENDVNEVVPVEKLFQLRRQLQENSDPNSYNHWARLFFSDERRRISRGFRNLPTVE